MPDELLLGGVTIIIIEHDTPPGPGRVQFLKQSLGQWRHGPRAPEEGLRGQGLDTGHRVTHARAGGRVILIRPHGGPSGHNPGHIRGQHWPMWRRRGERLR